MSRSATAITRLTVGEFTVYDIPEGRADLVRGELRMIPPPSGRHGALVYAIAKRLGDHVESRELGAVLIGASFELLALPRTVRAPDVAFVRAERLSAGGIGAGFMQVAPDLVVEIISPSETRARLREKLDDYRASAISLVWLIDPRTRGVTVIEADHPVRRLSDEEILTGGDVLPGFACEVAALFVGIA